MNKRRTRYLCSAGLFLMHAGALACDMSLT